MLGLAVWSGAYAVTWYVPTLAQQTFWLKVTALGSWLVPVRFLTLAFDIARMDRWRTPSRIVPIAIASFALANIEWLNPGQLFDTAFVAHEVGPYTRYVSVPGPLYWVFTVFAFTLIVVAFAIIFRVYLRSSGIERTHAALLLVGGLVPFLADVVIEYGSVPLGDLFIAPLTLLAIGIVWLFATLRGTLLSVLPLARDTLVEQMLDGVIVLDGRGRVVDANAPALKMLRAQATEVLGRSAEEVLD
jgi:PAS domain-containing protein